MVDLIGTTGLAISIVDDGIKVLSFVVKWIDNASHFGDHVRIFKTRLATEVARLQTVSGFFSQKSEKGVYRFEELSLISQRAAKGMIQELQITLASYSMLVAKYEIEVLQRGYESKNLPKGEALSIKSPFELETAGKTEGEKIQDDASWIRVTAWGLFQKKKIQGLIAEIATWNDQLQSLLMCALCFGGGLEVSKVTPLSMLRNLRMSTGVTLQKLVAESTAAGPELFPTSWALQKLRLPNADSRIQTLTTPNGSELVFVEYKPFEKEPSTVVRERMKRLAKLLSLPKAAESGFNTLRCIGVVRQDSPAKRFVFIFKMPTEVPGPPLSIDNVPIDLAGAVASSTIRRPTLGQKFKLAGVLAETVFQLHSVNWLHKSIRSENVLLPRHSTVIEYSKPYLVGFEFSRDENDRSTTEHDDILARNIYRHPDRHGPPEERFTVLHDIYALGVTLLEIGLWRPILGFDKNFGQKTPAEIKLCLESHARERLPHYMGTGYTTAVLHCLQGTLINTGQSNNALGVTWGDSQREQVQIALLETVIKGIDSGKIPD